MLVPVYVVYFKFLTQSTLPGFSMSESGKELIRFPSAWMITVRKKKKKKKMPWQLIKEKQVKNVYPELSGLESNDDPFPACTLWYNYHFSTLSCITNKKLHTERVLSLPIRSFCLIKLCIVILVDPLYLLLFILIAMSIFDEEYRVLQCSCIYCFQHWAICRGISHP